MNTENITNSDFKGYYKEFINYAIIIAVSFITGLIIAFFSYQKSIGSAGFLPELSPFVKSFANYGPEGLHFPLTKAIIYSSLSLCLLVLIIVIVSRIITWVTDNYA